MFRSLEEPVLDLGVCHRLLNLRLGHEVGPARLQRRETIRVPLGLLVCRPLLGEGGLRLRHPRLRPVDRRAEEGRVDLKQEVSLLHVLPFLHREFDDPPGDVGRDVHVRLGFYMACRGDVVDEIPQPYGLYADFECPTPFPLHGEESHGREKSNHDDRDDRFLHPVQRPLFRDSAGGPGDCTARARTYFIDTSRVRRGGLRGFTLLAGQTGEEARKHRDRRHEDQVEYQQIRRARRHGPSRVEAAHRHPQHPAGPNREDVDSV